MYLALSPLKYESIAIRATKVFHRQLSVPHSEPLLQKGLPDLQEAATLNFRYHEALQAS